MKPHPDSYRPDLPTFSLLARAKEVQCKKEVKITTQKYANPRIAAFRATLDRIPDDVALAIGLRVFDEDALSSDQACICGWAIRESIAREVGRDAEDIDFVGEIVNGCVGRFGGELRDWVHIFLGVEYDDDAPLIEEALFDRVMEAAEHT